MSNIWFISDTHFNHTNILSFESNGKPLRPEFNNVGEMNEYMITMWNQTVKPQDHIYHLGDIAIGFKGVPEILMQLQGHKRLVMGNHDREPIATYMKYFEKIKSYNVLDNIIFSHIPIHPESISHRWTGNVHGHLHSHLVQLEGEDDPRYINISVEQIAYTPVHLDEIVRRFKDAETKRLIS